jgi:hypothetical protein
MNMDKFVVGVIYILGPLLLLYGCKKSEWLNKFGTVGLAYVLGIIPSNIGLIRQ